MTANRRFPLRSIVTGLAADVLGYEVTQLPLHDAPLTGGALIAAGTLYAGARTAWWYTGRGSTTAAVDKWSRRSVRTGGTATWVDHQRRTSRRAIRRQAKHLRPSLASLNAWQLYRLDPTAYAVELGIAGRRRLFVGPRDNILRIGGTGSYKTTAMEPHIIDAPGGVVVTSTRVDVLRTMALRAKVGPVHLYDPVGLVGSTIKWSPLSGCTDSATATRRASDMLPEGHSAEGERWDAQARRILAVLFHAAALDRADMMTVMRWLTADGTTMTDVREQVYEALARSSDPTARASLQMSAVQFFANNERTRSSIVTTAMTALAWLTDPAAVRVGDSDASESLDIGDLLYRHGTLYIIGRKDGATGPLTGALIAEIMYLAEVAAERSPGGRLDPCLTLVLDEAAKVAPGPLHQWAADCGGRGINLDIAAQSLAAIEEVWGPYALEMLLANCNAKVIGAGTSAPRDLEHWETLGGTRKETVATEADNGSVISRTTRDVPIFPRAMIAALSPGTALVYGLGPVTLIRTPDARRRIARALKAAPAMIPAQTNYAAKVEHGEFDDIDEAA